MSMEVIGPETHPWGSMTEGEKALAAMRIEGLYEHRSVPDGRKDFADLVYLDLCESPEFKGQSDYEGKLKLSVDTLVHNQWDVLTELPIPPLDAFIYMCGKLMFEWDKAESIIASAGQLEPDFLAEDIPA